MILSANLAGLPLYSLKLNSARNKNRNAANDRVHCAVQSGTTTRHGHSGTGLLGTICGQVDSCLIHLTWYLVYICLLSYIFHRKVNDSY